MKNRKVVVKILPFILALAIPSIDYFNVFSDVTSPTSINPVLRWGFISVSLLGIWFLNALVTNYTKLQILIANILFSGLLISLSYLLYPESFSESDFARIIIPTLLFLAIQRSLKIKRQKEDLSSENFQLKAETYKMELRNLKNQINPHFLFNSLSNLQCLIRQDPKKANDYVLKLAEFYREILLGTTTDTKSIKDEIKIASIYLHLQKTRYEDALKFEIILDEIDENTSLPSFAMQLMVENCIKHNITSNNKPLYIKIFQNNPNTLCIENNFQPKLHQELSTKTGINNLNTRYKLLNVSNGVLVNQNNSHFSTTLKLIQK